MPEQFPQPTIDSDSQPYWDGLSNGELRIQRCEACNRHIFYPRSICPFCYTTRLLWITASGKGTIYSYTVVHQAFGVFAKETPYTIAIVELEEGVRLMSRIVDSTPELIKVGLPVQVVYKTDSEGTTLPYFQLAS